ncbi:MAG TPA: group II intron maturase-specific domain-containing protein [Roseateles sp.]
MAGQTGPNDPVDLESSDKVRQLQRQLWAAAKRAPGRRLHALYDQMCRAEILHEACKRVRRNKGAAGADRVTIGEVEQYGIRLFLKELAEVLRAGEYGAQVVRRTYIPKADGRKRPLGISAVRDRVVQMAAKLVLEPIFEADFKPCSFGFRPRRSATMALEELRTLGAQGADHVLDADIERQGAQGFDFLGCHLHKRMSGRLWEQKRLKRYYLQRWPSRKAMNRVRERVRELTPRGRCHQDLRSVIAELNPVLRGWGQYFQTGNAGTKFLQVDHYVGRRLQCLRLKRAGRTLQADQVERWNREYFESLGLYRLCGTIRYPGQSSRKPESA